MSFNAIRENKTVAKISELTVKLDYVVYTFFFKKKTYVHMVQMIPFIRIGMSSSSYTTNVFIALCYYTLSVFI